MKTKVVQRSAWVFLLSVGLAGALGFAQVAQRSDAGRAAASVDAGVATAGADAASSVMGTAADIPQGGLIVTSGAGSAGAEAGVVGLASASTEAGVVPVSNGPAAGLTEISAEAAPSVAPREAPTEAQVDALRQLEDEVNLFADRGRAFRGSLNELLAREHTNQLDRLRAGFQRQITAEREAEAAARRRAIEVAEHFVERYPDNAEHTPDVMFRLAELYFDEAAYAKLDADERSDRERASREAAGQSTDDLVPAAVDYRCSILLYRHIASRFPRFRHMDSTHYLLGWVLKEMGREEESVTSYRAMVCPSRFHYAPGMDLAAPLSNGQSIPMTCAHLAEVLQPLGPTLASPPQTGPDGGNPVEGSIEASLVAPPAGNELEPMSIPTDYAECTPMNGANGQPSHYAAEVWYYVGDFHFDNPPTRNAELGNAYAVAAFQAAMRASESRRPVVPAASRPAVAQGAAVGLQGGQQAVTPDGLVAPENSPGRSQFNPELQYGQFWPKSLYKIGWSFFRMHNGYPRALEAFSRLLDFYDFAGTDSASQGNRADTIKWIGVIFTEASWGPVTSANDAFECQGIVEQLAHPTPDPSRPPFDCAGIVRILSPYSPMGLMAGAAGLNGRAAGAPATPVGGPNGAGRVTPPPIARVTRPAPLPGRATFIPQDRPWTPEAYLELANDYFQQTKYYEAIALYRIFLQLYPLHFMAPRVTENIAESYERQRQFDLAIDARGGLANYLEGTNWWNANMSHPDAQRHAELVARNSLYNVAIQHHQAASRARQRSAQFRRCSLGQAADGTPPPCTAARNPRERAENEARALSEFQRSNTEYEAAIRAYTNFIASYPNDDSAYEFKFNRGEALYWAGRFEEAGRAYAEVRDSNESDQFLAQSAYMAVKSFEAAVGQAVTRTEGERLDPCLAIRAGLPAAQYAAQIPDEAARTACENVPMQPVAAGSTERPRPLQINILPIVRSLMEARIAYANHVPASLDNERALGEAFQHSAEAAQNPPFRPKFAYLNARTLMRFGFLTEAEARLRNVLQTYCNDPTVAGASLVDLRNIFVLTGRDEEIETLARAQTEGAHQCQGVTQETRDLMQGDLTDALFRRALGVFRQAEAARGDEQLRLYEQAARAMRRAVNANRNHPQAPLALYYTALAYERTNRFDTATQTYRQVTEQYNNLNVIGVTPPRELTGEDRTARVNLLEVSNFRAAVNLERTFDYDTAIRYYGNVVTDPRFAPAQDHRSHIHDALSSIALIQTNLGHWTQAREAWHAFEPAAGDDRERALAHYRVAEMSFKEEAWAAAIRSLQEYRRTTPMNATTAEYHVQAQYNIATAYRRQNNTAAYQRELRAVAAVYRQSGQPAGSRAAGFAAEALFLDLDTRVTAFLARTLTQGDADSLAAQVRTIKTELTGLDAQAQEIINLRGGEYTIAAAVRRGEAHEFLATQEARISQLFQFSRAQTAQFATVTRQLAQLRHAADLLDRVNRNEQAEGLRTQAQTIEDRIAQQRDQITADIQQRFDREAEAERTLAIQDFAVAIALARRDNIPTSFSARALEHIRQEENRPLIEAAVRGIRPEVAAAASLTYSANMFNTDAPGVTLTQDRPIATPGLVAE